MHRAKFCHLYREVFLAGPDKPLNALIAEVGKCCRLTTFSKRCPSKLKCQCTVTYPQSDSGIQQSVAKFYELRREQGMGSDPNEMVALSQFKISLIIFRSTGTKYYFRNLIYVQRRQKRSGWTFEKVEVIRFLRSK